MENLPPHVLRLVYKEVSALAADPPEGIKIYPSEEDITELHTAIEGPGKDFNMVSSGIGYEKIFKNEKMLQGYMNVPHCVCIHIIRNNCIKRHSTIYSTQISDLCFIY